MRWIDKLERRHGDLAIPNLINIVLIGQLVVWFVVMFISTFPLEFFPLIRSGLLHGQVWRAVTFIFVPTLTTSPLALLLELYFYWWIGNALTRAWGDFRFTVYWVTGMIGAVLSCLGDRRGRHGGAVLLAFLCLCLALAGTAHPALLHPAAQDQMGRLGVGHPLGAELPDRFAERQGQPAVRPGRLLPLLWQGAVRLVPGYHPWLQAPQRVGKPLEISRICPTAGPAGVHIFPKGGILYETDYCDCEQGRFQGGLQ